MMYRALQTFSPVCLLLIVQPLALLSQVAAQPTPPPPTPEQGLLTLVVPDGPFCYSSGQPPVAFTPGECFYNPLAASIPGYYSRPGAFFARVFLNTSDGVPLYAGSLDKQCDAVTFAAQLPQAPHCAPIQVTKPASGDMGPSAPAYPLAGWVAQLRYKGAELVYSVALPQAQPFTIPRAPATEAVYCSEDGRNVTVVQATFPTRWAPGNMTAYKQAATGVPTPQTVYLCGAPLATPVPVPPFQPNGGALTASLYPGEDAHCRAAPLFTARYALGACVADATLGGSGNVYECGSQSAYYEQAVFSDMACKTTPPAQLSYYMAACTGYAPNWAYACEAEVAQM